MADTNKADASKQTQSKTVSKIATSPNLGIADKKAAPKETTKTAVVAATVKPKAAAKKVEKPAKAKSKLAAKKVTKKAAKPLAKKSKPAATKQKTTKTLKDMEKTMTQSKAKLDAFTQDLTNSGREGFETYYKSYGLFVKGLEDIAKAQAGFIQSFTEKQAKVVNDSFKVKTLNELSELQNSASQEAFNDLMDIATKTSEQYVKVVTESLDPINAQINKTIQKVSDSIAA